MKRLLPSRILQRISPLFAASARLASDMFVTMFVAEVRTSVCAYEIV